jgi:DNA-binding protein HU-beta
MNKAELIAAVAADTKESKVVVTKVVESLFDVIAETLKNNDEVRVPSFGVFEVVDTAARKARNPKTNEEVTVPAGKRARFKPGKSLKESLDILNGRAP